MPCARSLTNSALAFLSFTALALVSASASAVQVTPAVTINTPCAWLESFGGHVQILDASRTRLLETSEHSEIPCGGWVTVDQGWAFIQHRDGQKFRAGPESFLEVPENNTDGHHLGDQVVLYKGQIFAEAPEDAGELRVATVNARARFKNAKGIVLFSEKQEDTQLICVERIALLENRFQISKKISVKAGEATSLNFKALRVVPSTPMAVAAAPLKKTLVDFHLSEREQEKVLKTIHSRQDRKFASVLNTRGEDEEEQQQREQAEKAAARADRAPAGLEVEEGAELPRVVKSGPRSPAGKRKAVYSKDYDRHRKSPVDDRLMDHWTKKMVAGQETGERILHPDKFYGRPQKVKISVEDKSKPGPDQKSEPVDREKARLLDELSQIHSE